MPSHTSPPSHTNIMIFSRTRNSASKPHTRRLPPPAAVARTCIIMLEDPHPGTAPSPSPQTTPSSSILTSSQSNPASSNSEALPDIPARPPPSSPVCRPTSPDYSPTTPPPGHVYQSATLVYQPMSPGHVPFSPICSPTSPLYEPTSPECVPASPHYNLTGKPSGFHSLGDLDIKAITDSDASDKSASAWIALQTHGQQTGPPF